MDPSLSVEVAVQVFVVENAPPVVVLVVVVGCKTVVVAVEVAVAVV